MPSQQKKSFLQGKCGDRLKKAAAAHANDPVDYGNQRVPPGITNGIAKLVDVKFGEYQSGPSKGEPYCRFAGVIVSPDEVMVNGMMQPCKGMQTSIMEALCDTKTGAGKVTTFEEHVASVQNEMKKLGGEDFDVEDVEAAAENLKEAKPYFRFSTSVRKAQEYFDKTTKQKKMGEEGVWENWFGSKGLEDHAPEESGGVVDETGEEEKEEEVVEEVEEVVEEAAVEDEEEAAAEEEGKEGPGDNELDELAEKADAKDKAAIKQLQAYAKEAGLDAGVVEEAASWADVANIIRESAAPAEEAEAEPEAEAFKPVKGEMYPYVVKDKNGKPLLDAKKKPRKPVECEVVAVDAKAETVTLRNADDGKTLYKGVAWSEIQTEA